MTNDEAHLYRKAEDTLVSMFAIAHELPTATWQTIQDSLENIDIMYLLQCLKLTIDGKSHTAQDRKKTTLATMRKPWPH